MVVVVVTAGADPGGGGVRTPEMFEGRPDRRGGRAAPGGLRPEQARGEGGRPLATPNPNADNSSSTHELPFVVLVVDLSVSLSHIYGAWESIKIKTCVYAGEQVPQVPGLHVEPTVVGHGDGRPHGHRPRQRRGKP